MTPSQLIDKRIAETKDWRGELLEEIRNIIHEADPGIKEEWKWDTAVFNYNGLICAINAFKDHVKINFFKGILLKDPHKLINNGFESKTHRAIDFTQHDKVNEYHLIELIKEAVKLNEIKN